MKVSNNFMRSEFACKCGCNFKSADIELVKYLEDIRIRFGKAVNITNACRCLKHNRDIGSLDTSQHVKGMAADIWLLGVTSEELYNYIDKELLPNYGGVGMYDTFVHLDTRDNEKARWDNRTTK